MNLIRAIMKDAHYGANGMWVQMIALFLRHERLHWVATTVALILATACLVSAVGMAAGALKYL